MRAPFNTTCDIYDGPEGASPGTLRAADVPCRLVPDLAFVDSTNPLLASVSYVNLDAVEPIAPLWSPIDPCHFTVNLDAADRISIAGAPVTMYQVIRVESRTWPTGENYWRAHLVLPISCTGGAVGCDAYSIAPWTLLLERAGAMLWGSGDTLLTTDGAGNWELLDVGDDIIYYADSWDGEGSKVFIDPANPTYEVTVTCSDG